MIIRTATLEDLDHVTKLTYDAMIILYLMSQLTSLNYSKHYIFYCI